MNCVVRNRIGSHLLRELVLCLVYLAEGEARPVQLETSVLGEVATALVNVIVLQELLPQAREVRRRRDHLIVQERCLRD